MIKELTGVSSGEKANEKAGGGAGGKAAGTTCKEGDKKAVEGSVRKEGFLAELGNAPGTVKMVLVSPKAVEEKSQESIDNAMFVIQVISKKVMDTVEASRVLYPPVLYPPVLYPLILYPPVPLLLTSFSMSFHRTCFYR